ncbi:oxygen-independent coproporphyrinogen III oxidase [Poseidonocella sedimentorum]|uniref:Coproporphyrinogen-III oxidase n=1 Tax=Poseidonocella sedimentorum TaxID=871652 RepID=A0A1I6DUR8_9RHOB|nr:oxygen-independent coproporphyrinogen III oxidase [Poseidonocella sedimentorum]SFR09229.1 oxygen-independent coproporphyrinogen-3 oxidase [Poseidonocella sedimentorum]
MEHDLFEKYGLFSSRVPRYTSYPPANRFEDGMGHRRQAVWLNALDDDETVSIYIHIPFCRRLCWFCACRTQGTQTMRPVEAYVEHLLREIESARRHLAPGIRMSRLHLGGGTPTILAPALMDRLLTAVFSAFGTAPDFEFSVEVDPTDAPEEVLDVLLAHGLDRASIGIQDFQPGVQKAIGRMQSVSQTVRVVNYLRAAKLRSINFDLLYGLPHQDEMSLMQTIETVLRLRPDRLALYGYAHVPWMSKRQGMIPDEALPDPKARLEMAERAADRLTAGGYVAIGIDHFAQPSDGLALAQRAGRLKRNFQGYTDDPAEVLLGFGASAISRFPQGYVQNAVATAAYQERIGRHGLAGAKGHEMSVSDCVIATMIEEVMCYGSIHVSDLSRVFQDAQVHPQALAEDLLRQFPDLLEWDGAVLRVGPHHTPFIRIVASALDAARPSPDRHSLAV